ncbi:MAG: sugar phosphate isomerase/epimerase [Sphingobacterium sp.]|nr:sugar phosphate isomerase/epimerase [Sphingobacterium sp.]
MRKLLIVICLLFTGLYDSQAQIKEHAHQIGYSIDFKKITLEKMRYAKSVGIDYIELAGVSSILDKELNLKGTKSGWKIKVDSLKGILDAAGIKVWSIHMPFSKDLDLSLVDEVARQKVIQTQLAVAEVFSPAQPQIMLFHPSYFLGNNEREARINQLVRSVDELYLGLERYDVQMVVENMLGPNLTMGDRERPLLRTVEECQLVFRRFPEKVGIAVDMCHIANPEKLLLAFGQRVKTLHVSDGNGQAELHYLPCNKKGENDWTAIFAALDKINYEGVFMYECKYSDERELTDCYDELRKQYVNSL